MSDRFHRMLQERFGDPIGSYAGDAPVGVRDEESCDEVAVTGRHFLGSGGATASGFEAHDIEGNDVEPCDECGMLPTDEGCGCVHEAKKKGPSKKTAKSWVKGTKKFSDKVSKAKRAGADDPAAFAAWMQHRATGTWPSQD